MSGGKKQGHDAIAHVVENVEPGDGADRQCQKELQQVEGLVTEVRAIAVKAGGDAQLDRDL